MRRLLDDGEQVIRAEPAGEIECRTSPRRDADPVVSIDDVVLVESIGAVRNDPPGDRRIARSTSDHVDSTIGWESSKPPEPSGSRTGDGHIGPGKADRDASAQLIERSAGSAIRASEHQLDGT